MLRVTQLHQVLPVPVLDLLPGGRCGGGRRLRVLPLLRVRHHAEAAGRRVQRPDARHPHLEQQLVLIEHHPDHLRHHRALLPRHGHPLLRCRRRWHPRGLLRGTAPLDQLSVDHTNS